MKLPSNIPFSMYRFKVKLLNPRTPERKGVLRLRHRHLQHDAGTPAA
jgi:hypothetical protein